MLWAAIKPPIAFTVWAQSSVKLLKRKTQCLCIHLHFTLHFTITYILYYMHIRNFLLRPKLVSSIVFWFIFIVYFFSERNGLSKKKLVLSASSLTLFAVSLRLSLSLRLVSQYTSGLRSNWKLNRYLLVLSIINLLYLFQRSSFSSLSTSSFSLTQLIFKLPIFCSSLSLTYLSL